MYCPKCGSENPEDARYCTQCRARLDELRNGEDQPPRGGPGADNSQTRRAPARRSGKLIASVLVVLVIAVGTWWSVGRGLTSSASTARMASSSSTAAPLSVVTASPSGQPTSAAQPSEHIHWEVPAGALPAADTEGLKTAVEGVHGVASGLEGGSVSVVSAEMAGQWAMLTVQDKAPPGSPVQATGAFEMVARKEGETWKALTPLDPDFCQMMTQMPDNLMSKDYYVGCRGGK